MCLSCRTNLIVHNHFRCDVWKQKYFESEALDCKQPRVPFENDLYAVAGRKTYPGF
jgi:hypothetical protein